jgi:hypothetical protein
MVKTSSQHPDSWYRVTFRLLLMGVIILIAFFLAIRYLEMTDDAYDNRYWWILERWEVALHFLIPCAGAVVFCLSLVVLPWSPVSVRGGASTRFWYGAAGIVVAGLCLWAFSLGLNPMPH